MPEMRILARRYDTREAVRIELADGAIRAVQAAEPGRVAADLPWISPGWVDVQVNGFGGIAFNDPSLTIEQIVAVSKSLDAHGVTCYCPTVTTESFERLRYALGSLARAVRTSGEVRRRVGGIHLEGPFISPDDGPRGAHPRQHVRAPDWDEFRRLQDAAEGNIRILTLSPEYPRADEFIARVAQAGVVAAIGHTQADADQIRAAVDAGARLSTHLGNGAHGSLRRHPNYIWDQLAEDRLCASLILDGHHLPPAVVKTFLRAKTPRRCILVSDLTSMGGLPPGRYSTTSLGAVDVLDDGRLVIAGQQQLLAGASLPIGAGIANVLRFTEHDLQVAVEMASLQPASLLGHAPGRLEPGSPADLTLFRLAGAAGDVPLGDLEIVATINAGEPVWGALPS